MFIIKYLKSLLYIFIFIFLFSIIIGTFSYFNIINNLTINILEIIAIIISASIGGICLGKNCLKNGYLEGIKIGLITIIILFAFSFLGSTKQFSLSSLFFYIIILFSTILGSVIGINRKDSK